MPQPEIKRVPKKRENEIRCMNPQCRGLLMVATTVIGELRCHRCKHTNLLNIVSQKDLQELA